MDAQSFTREMLSSIKTYDDFFALCRSLSAVEESTLFEFLFPIAISAHSGDNANSIAGFALLELEPKCQMSCEETVEAISNSRWDVSNREIPFYLISQFGKWRVGEAVTAFLKNPRKTDEQKRYVETIWYWAGLPSIKLAEKLFYWEWQEAIEGPSV
jgi:hypothetical protein